MNSIFSIESIDVLKFSHFAPIDRETPIIEISLGGKILIDFSYRNDDSNQEVEILFHDDFSGCKIKKELLNEIIESGIRKLRMETD